MEEIWRIEVEDLKDLIVIDEKGNELLKELKMS